MIQLVIVSIISFLFGFLIRIILENIGTKRRFERVKKWSELTLVEKRKITEIK